MNIGKYPFDSNVPEIMDMLVVEFEEEEYRLQQLLKETENGRNNNKDNKKSSD